MFNTLLKGLSLIGLMFICLVNVAHANVTCAEGTDLACDVTLTSPIANPALFCGVTTLVSFTLTDNLPFPVSYSFTLTDNNGNYIGTVTRDPSSTCAATTLFPGSCTLVLAVNPACPPVGNLNYTLNVLIAGTTQAPLSSTLNSTVSTAPVPGAFTPAQALRTAASCAVLANTTITNAPGVIPNQFTNGNVCLYAGTAVTGIDPSSVNPAPPGFGLHIADAIAQQAQADLTGAIGFLNSQPCGTLNPSLAGPVTITATSSQDVLCFTSSADITSGLLTLSCGAFPGCVFIFQIPSTLTAETGTAVAFSNGATAANTYWVVGSSATLLGASFAGNILASASISFSTTGTLFTGRALASTGAVTFISNPVIVP